MDDEYEAFSWCNLSLELYTNAYICLYMNCVARCWRKHISVVASYVIGAPLYTWRGGMHKNKITIMC